VAPKDTRASVTEGFENSREIEETLEIALEQIRREEDDHRDDGKTFSMIWTMVNRD
jgi:hypothetical protein